MSAILILLLLILLSSQPPMGAHALLLFYARARASVSCVQRKAHILRFRTRLCSWCRVCVCACVCNPFLTRSLFLVPVSARTRPGAERPFAACRSRSRTSLRPVASLYHKNSKERAGVRASPYTDRRPKSLPPRSRRARSHGGRRTQKQQRTLTCTRAAKLK